MDGERQGTVKLIKITHSSILQFAKHRDIFCEIQHFCLFRFIRSCLWPVTRVKDTGETIKDPSTVKVNENCSRAGNYVSRQAGSGICCCIDCPRLLKCSGQLNGVSFLPHLTTCVPLRPSSSWRHTWQKTKVAVFFNVRTLLVKFSATTAAGIIRERGPFSADRRGQDRGKQRR